MTRLNQIIAVEKGVVSRSEAALTLTYHQIQKTALLQGISRSYQPRNEEGEALPGESTKVQVKVSTVLDNLADQLTRWFDVVATKEHANREAHADVVVDGDVLLPDVPVTYLLFLEKRLVDLRTLVSKLPTLDPAEDWDEDMDGTHVTQAILTTRSKKVPRNHVKAVATEKHPAQVEVYFEDVVVGDWTTRKFSGALPKRRVDELLARIESLQAAVKYAREEANTAVVDDVRVGRKVFAYILDEAA